MVQDEREGAACRTHHCGIKQLALESEAAALQQFVRP